LLNFIRNFRRCLKNFRQSLMNFRHSMNLRLCLMIFVNVQLFSTNHNVIHLIMSMFIDEFMFDEMNKSNYVVKQNYYFQNNSIRLSFKIDLTSSSYLLFSFTFLILNKHETCRSKVHAKNLRFSFRCNRHFCMREYWTRYSRIRIETSRFIEVWRMLCQWLINRYDN
jgi:hypothetical protein